MSSVGGRVMITAFKYIRREAPPGSHILWNLERVGDKLVISTMIVIIEPPPRSPRGASITVRSSDIKPPTILEKALRKIKTV